MLILIPPSIYRHPVELIISVQSTFSSSTWIFDIIYWHGQHSPGWDCELASCGPPKRSWIAIAFSQLKRNKFELVTYRWKGFWLHIHVCIMHLLPNAVFGLLTQIVKTPYNSANSLLLGFTTFSKWNSSTSALTLHTWVGLGQICKLCACLYSLEHCWS